MVTNTWILVDDETGRKLRIGDKVTTFRDEPGTITHLRPPHKVDSSGHVSIAFPSKIDRERDWVQEYYPSVIGAHYADEISL